MQRNFTTALRMNLFRNYAYATGPRGTELKKHTKGAVLECMSVFFFETGRSQLQVHKAATQGNLLV